MATDGPDPPPCDDEIFKHGTVVFIGDSVSSNRMEAWVRKLAQLSEQRVDWHFSAGNAVVLALGDITKVKATIEEQMDYYYQLRTESLGLDPLWGTE